MLANELQAVSTVNESLKLYKGETIRKMLNETFGDKTVKNDIDEAKSDLEKFYNDEGVDFYETHHQGVFGAIELIRDHKHDLKEKEKIMVDPCKMVNVINQIRSTNIIKRFFQNDNGKKYTKDSLIDVKLMKAFENFRLDELNNTIDLSDDDLPF